jgi:hypothetical protein
VRFLVLAWAGTAVSLSVRTRRSARSASTAVSARSARATAAAASSRAASSRAWQAAWTVLVSRSAWTVLVSRSACRRAAARSAAARCASPAALSHSRTAVSRVAAAARPHVPQRRRGPRLRRARRRYLPAGVPVRRPVLLRRGRVLRPGRGRRRPRRRPPRPSRRTPLTRRPARLQRGPRRPRWRLPPRPAAAATRPGSASATCAAAATASREASAGSCDSFPSAAPGPSFRDLGRGRGPAAHRVVVPPAALVSRHGTAHASQRSKGKHRLPAQALGSRALRVRTHPWRHRAPDRRDRPRHHHAQAIGEYGRKTRPNPVSR